jgi:hypothetical protein
VLGCSKCHCEEMQIRLLSLFHSKVSLKERKKKKKETAEKRNEKEETKGNRKKERKKSGNPIPQQKKENNPLASSDLASSNRLDSFESV